MLHSIPSKIPAFIKFILKTYFLTIGLFIAYRLLFFYFNKPTVIAEETTSAFVIAMLFDNALFCYISFLPLLVLSIHYISNLPLLQKMGYWFYLLCGNLYLLVCDADIPYFKQFGNHLSKNALLWAESPAFMLEMIFGNVSYWGFFIVFFISSILFYVFLNRFYNTFQKQALSETKMKWFYFIPFFLVVTGITILGARGRTSSKQVLHEGLAIVSTNPFVNQIALNPNYTFWKSLFKSKKNNYQAPANTNEYYAFSRKYLGITSPFQKNIDRDIIPDSSAHKYNIVIVIMESASVYKMGYYGGKNLTPNLHALNKEAVFCENFFSSGIHTFNGLFSTITGFPSIYTEKGLRSYIKKPFNGLGTLLKKQGYTTYFYTTHDPHFDNMEGFYKLNGFEHIISDQNFDASEALSNCGVPDHKLFHQLIETHATSQKPFLSVVMTGSDHGPWKIPTDISFKPNGANEQENCTLYADWSVGQLIAEAKKQTWFSNTIFVFLGDHGLTTNNTYEMPLSFNHIPCIIYQPSILKADTISAPCTQADIPATMMGLLQVPYTNKSFGINILKEQHPFVVFSADDKLGYVDNQGFYYYKTLNDNQRYLKKYKNLDATNYMPTHKQAADSMDKSMMMLYGTAHDILRNEYYLLE